MIKLEYQNLVELIKDLRRLIPSNGKASMEEAMADLYGHKFERVQGYDEFFLKCKMQGKMQKFCGMAKPEFCPWCGIKLNLPS